MKLLAKTTLLYHLCGLHQLCLDIPIEGTFDAERAKVFGNPITYMNLSGEAVRLVVDYYKIDINDILIIHDDLDLPTGKIRLRQTGSSGGHNGIKSIIRDLGTERFNRLKIGIRHPKNATVVSWVLTPFNDEQQKLMDDAFDTSVKIIDDFIAGRDSQYLMNKYN